MTDTVRVQLPTGGSLLFDPDHYGGQYALHCELAEGFNDIGDYWRSMTRTRRRRKPMSTDSVDHPSHYTGHPSGVECITVTEHMNFCRGNAMKYLWRAGEKSNELEDLRKARWYIDREISRIENSGGTDEH